VAGFDVTPVELQICGSSLTEITDGLQTELDVLRSEMDALFSTGWQGQAATGFAQGWAQWQTGAADVLTGLRDMAALLNTTGQNYATTDQSATQGVRDAGADL